MYSTLRQRVAVDAVSCIDPLDQAPDEVMQDFEVEHTSCCHKICADAASKALTVATSAALLWLQTLHSREDGSFTLSYCFVTLRWDIFGVVRPGVSSKEETLPVP